MLQVKPARTARLGTVVVVAIFALTSCSLTFNIGNDGSPSSQRESAESSGEFTMNELMFAQMMIPHHEQAIEMSELALSRSTNDSIRDLSERIIAGQEPEIEIMQGWLDRTDSAIGDGQMGSGMDNPMGQGGKGGMGGMGGMATESELRELATLESPEFDLMFLELMIDHHEGAIDMVRMISRSDHREVSDLAEDIVRVQREEITEMFEIAGTIREG